MTDADLVRRRYRLLLRLYPEEHRARYGAEMEDTFLALLRRDEGRRGRLGRWACWAGAAWDALFRGARLRARTALGHTTTGGGRDVMGTLVSDIRYAVRSLLRRPVLAVTAVATLALGIGANASVFTIVNGFLLRPLPYGDPQELVVIWAENPELGWRDTDTNMADAWDWRARARTLDDLAVFNEDDFNLTGDGPPQLVAGIRTTPNVLRLLGRSPVLGRDFADDEMGDGRDGVVILTDGFWQRRFGGDPDVLGSTLTLDGVQKTVVGILPPDFLFLDERPDLFIPWQTHPESAARGNHNTNTVARLADGATLAQARDELAAISRQLEEEHPEQNQGWTTQVVSAHEDMMGDVAKQASYVLLTAVSFILLMACVNVANLLLARAGARRQEFAVRSALGAGRGRVLRQLLTESLVLAVLGGGLGILLAQWGYRSIAAALPSGIPPVFEFTMDGTVLLYSVGITLLSAVGFGLAPALRSTSGPMGDLRDGGRGSAGRRSGRFGSTLVVVQTALAVVLLVGGGLLMKSIAGMRNQDFGFEPEGVLTARISPPGSAYAAGEEVTAFWRTVEDRVAEVAGIEAVGSTQSHPLMGSNWGNTVRVAGPGGPPSEPQRVRLTWVTPGYFDALGVEILQGRALTEADAADGGLVVMVNEAFVHQYLGDGVDPLQAYIVGEEDAPDTRIVGVVRNVVERGLDDAPEPSLYGSIDAQAVRTRSLVIRTAGAPRDFVDDVEAAVWSVDANLPLFSVETMPELIERRVGGFAVIGYLMGTFALMSLVLGAVGIYGVTAYSAQQRTAEIGVRLAMGAEHADVVGMVVRQGAMRALLGLVVGLALAFAMGGALSGILVGVEPSDPTTFALVVGVLGMVSVLGLWLPARRAARVDPVRALSAD